MPARLEEGDYQMKIFLDTANLVEIKEAVSWGVVDGVTTNPSLVAREEGVFHKILLEISSMVAGPISAEVLSLEAREMVQEARILASIAPQIVIKVPVTPEGLKAARELKEEGIKTNVTLIFSLNQALLAARAGGAFVSPFLGRLDDIGHDGIALVQDIVEMLRYYDLPTEVIAASIRHPYHMVEAARIGADIATVPFKVLKQMFEHPLTEQGIEAFVQDWEAGGRGC